MNLFKKTKLPHTSHQSRARTIQNVGRVVFYKFPSRQSRARTVQGMIKFMFLQHRTQTSGRRVGGLVLSAKNENGFSGSSGTNRNTQSLNTEPFKSEQENCQTSSQYSSQEALLPQAPCYPSIYLPSGWYVNVGAAFCGGCQLYGTLLQRLQM